MFVYFLGWANFFLKQLVHVFLHTLEVVMTCAMTDGNQIKIFLMQFIMLKCLNIFLVKATLRLMVLIKVLLLLDLWNLFLHGYKC